jgi:hypothetical protein
LVDRCHAAAAAAMKASGSLAALVYASIHRATAGTERPFHRQPGFPDPTRQNDVVAARCRKFCRADTAKALKDQFGVEADVNKTMVCLRRALEVSELEIEISSFEVMKLSLLQAALHNFEASECEAGAFHRESGFVVETSTPGTFEVIALNISVRQFLSLCRKLDIGAQYQTV